MRRGTIIVFSLAALLILMQCGEKKPVPMDRPTFDDFERVVEGDSFYLGDTLAVVTKVDTAYYGSDPSVDFITMRFSDGHEERHMPLNWYLRVTRIAKTRR